MGGNLAATDAARFRTNRSSSVPRRGPSCHTRESSSFGLVTAHVTSKRVNSCQQDIHNDIHESDRLLTNDFLFRVVGG